MFDFYFSFSFAKDLFILLIIKKSFILNFSIEEFHGLKSLFIISGLPLAVIALPGIFHKLFCK